MLLLKEAQILGRLVPLYLEFQNPQHVIPLVLKESHNFSASDTASPMPICIISENFHFFLHLADGGGTSEEPPKSKKMGSIHKSEEVWDVRKTGSMREKSGAKRPVRAFRRKNGDRIRVSFY